jgi:hypothetical protein
MRAANRTTFRVRVLLAAVVVGALTIRGGVGFAQYGPPPLEETQHALIIRKACPADGVDDGKSVFHAYRNSVDALIATSMEMSKWVGGLHPWSHRAYDPSLDELTRNHSRRWDRELRRLIRDAELTYFTSIAALPGADPERVESLHKRWYVERLLNSGSAQLSHTAVVELGIDFDSLERAAGVAEGDSPGFQAFLQSHIAAVYELAVALQGAILEWELGASVSMNQINWAARLDPAADLTDMITSHVESRVAPLHHAYRIRRANEQFATMAFEHVAAARISAFQRECDRMLLPGFAPVAAFEDLCTRALALDGLSDEQRSAIIEVQTDIVAYWSQTREKAAAAHRDVLDIDKHRMLHKSVAHATIEWARNGTEMEVSVTNPSRVYHEAIREIRAFIDERAQALHAVLGEVGWRRVQ